MGGGGAGGGRRSLGAALFPGRRSIGGGSGGDRRRRRATMRTRPEVRPQLLPFQNICAAAVTDCGCGCDSLLLLLLLLLLLVVLLMTLLMPLLLRLLLVYVNTDHDVQGLTVAVVRGVRCWVVVVGCWGGRKRGFDWGRGGIVSCCLP